MVEHVSVCSLRHTGCTELAEAAFLSIVDTPMILNPSKTDTDICFSTFSQIYHNCSAHALPITQILTFSVYEFNWCQLVLTA